MQAPNMIKMSELLKRPEIATSLRQDLVRVMTSKEAHDLFPPTRRAKLGVLAATALMLMSQSCVAEDTTIDTKAGTIKVETIAHGLENPWGLAFLPDDRMLVTERPGRLRIVTKDGTISEPLKGVPEVFAEGQGGLLDVKLDPDFATNRLVYIAYSEPGDGGAGTAVARGKLGTDSLDDVEVIFRQHPKVDGPNHFGGQLLFAPDGKLFVSARRALHVHSGPGSLQRSRQDRAHQSGRLGAEGQSFCRPGGGEARNLDLWSSQSARPGLRSKDRQTVRERARAQGW